MLPDPLVARVASALPPGRALDLACGSGRHALWLAERGWQVTAVDASASSLAEMKGNAGVDARVADLEKHEFAIEPEAWDLVLISRYLQRDLFEPAKRGVKRGGVLIAVVLLEDPANPEGRFRARPGELRSYFEGWEILHDDEGASGDRPIASIAGRRTT